jgi:ribulose-5-phosphate 4-epimerase/fuculose-1-phosphate aldolase
MALTAVPETQDPLRQARIDLAVAYRLVHRFGFDDTIWNHLSLSVPDRPDLFLVKPHGLLYHEITASNLLAVDAEGNTVEGTGRAERSGVCIHSRVHRLKANAACVLHTHMRYATWLSMVEKGRLWPINQNSLRFVGRISYDEDYSGLASDFAEGERIAATLGDNNIAILANHGVIVTGASVAEAIYDLYYLEVSCAEQYRLACSGQPPRFIPDDVIAKAQEQYPDLEAGAAFEFFEAMKRELDRDEPDYRD